jgi:hypothetical protein
MVAPRGNRVDPDDDEDLRSGEEDVETADAEPAPAQDSLFPSSLGLSFRVDEEVGELRVEARWGRYVRIDNPLGEQPARVWQREQRGGAAALELTGRRVTLQLDPEQPDVVAEAFVRPVRGGARSVTLFLRNNQVTPKRGRDTAWLFQVSLSVTSADGRAAFVAREEVGAAEGGERAQLAMAYRTRVEHAVGHGCGVHAELAAEDVTRAVRLETKAMPEYELPQMQPPAPSELPGLELDMRKLSQAPDAELPSLLEPLVTAYGHWIATQRTQVEEGADGLGSHRPAAMEALTAAEKAERRIASGISLLRENADARIAFRFAMEAMALQRVHTLWAENRRRGGDRPLAEFDRAENHTWRPFQLAFILLNLPAIADLSHLERTHSTDAAADLLWFPTGGGKTEAYLGLSAFTLAIRRLQGHVEGRRGDVGVAVLMRYTLRVLTLQQFQRASALVCACETLRRGDPDRWGEEPFRIGLWVGARSSPNSIDRALEALKEARGEGWSGLGGTPHQLPSCPWCGSAIEPGRDIAGEALERGRARILTYCGDPLGTCEFSRAGSPREGLPVMVVDEEIYRRLPSLLIATVDKFAQLPWKGETQTLFGLISGRCERHGFRSPSLEDADSHRATPGGLPAARTVDLDVLVRPPDLVIQDELHLISGPLGTMVGLYETAVDELMSWDVGGVRVRPKVVASTATIRQAREQVHALFLRRVEIFPPPALDASDSFFAQERELSDEDPGRLYVGVCATGRRLKAALIRVYVAFLAAAWKLYEEQGERVDPWLTLVGYFNAMQELAGMRRLCDDDVRTRLGKIDRRGLARRSIDPRTILELTSRVSASQIPGILDRMERTFPPLGGERLRGEERPLDVLLATNMISVGVDVGRLGLMVVAGQPKTTAEYIQATSRVGRTAAAPGVVCTVYNWARPRDLSHYERFEHYHATFYGHVEPLSVTPFAPRALDRGLSALLVSLIRLASERYNVNGSAQQLARDDPLVVGAVAEIIRRAREVTSSDATGDAVRAELEHRLDEWLATAERRTKTGSLLGYETSPDGRTVGLLTNPSAGDWPLFTCLNSLRDVEPTVGLVLDDRALFPEAPE